MLYDLAKTGAQLAGVLAVVYAASVAAEYAARQGWFW